MNVEQLRFTKDQYIVKEGDTLSNLIVLQSGEVIVESHGKEIAKISEKNTFLGEISFLLEVPTTASLKAAGYCNVLKIPATSAEDFFSKFPQLALKMCKVLAQRLQDTTKKISS